MRHVQFSVIGLMAVVGLVALDLWVLRAFSTAPSQYLHYGVIAILPMLNILAVCLALAIGSLVVRGEVSLSRVVFLLVGGLATFGLFAVTVLSPLTFFEYLNITAGSLRGFLLTTSQKRAMAAGTFAPPMYWRVIGFLLIFVVSTPVPLLPALLAGRAAQAYRLKLQSTSETTGATGPTDRSVSTLPV